MCKKGNHDNYTAGTQPEIPNSSRLALVAVDVQKNWQGCSAMSDIHVVSV